MSAAPCCDGGVGGGRSAVAGRLSEHCGRCSDTEGLETMGGSQMYSRLEEKEEALVLEFCSTSLTVGSEFMEGSEK